MKPLLEAASNKKASAGGTASNTEPWEPAQGLLKDVLKDTGDLRTHYQQNPFNDLQKTAYQNQFSQLDNFNNQVMPGLMQGFQGLLGPQFGNIGLGGSRASQPTAGAGLLDQTNAQLLQAASGNDPRYANASFGQIDWNAMNPWNRGAAAQAAASSPVLATQQARTLTPEEQEAERQRQEQELALARYYEATSAGDSSGDGGSSGSW